MRQRLIFKTAAYILVFGLLLSMLIFFLNYQEAKKRDYQRLEDMKSFQTAMIAYYGKFNTFLIPDCPANAALNYCLGQGDKKVDFSRLIDPLNSGVYQYLVINTDEGDFAVKFSLETGMAGLPSGEYLMTKEGIRK